MKGAIADNEILIQALEDVKRAFGCRPGETSGCHNAPVWDEDIDNDGTQGHVPPGIEPGVNLIYQLDEEVPASTTINFTTPAAGNFDDIFDYRFGPNNAFLENGGIGFHGLLDPSRICGTGADIAKFGTQAERGDANCVNIIHAKSMVFRYALFGHLFTENTNSTGVSTPGGFELFISGDNVKAAVGSEIRVGYAGTFMHEMGHTLGLHHGGNQEDSPGTRDDAYNCKPNYFSVMNYHYQLPLADPARPLDYSSWQATTLDEASLDEHVGVQAPFARKVLFGTLTNNQLWGGLAKANQPIDWNRSFVIDTNPVSADVNDPGLLSVDWRIALTCRFLTPGQVLTGFDDWKNLQYNFRKPGIYPYSSGISVIPVSEIPNEPTVGQLQKLAAVVDYDDDGVANSLDTCPAVANPDQRIPNGVDCGVSFRRTVLLPLVRR